MLDALLRPGETVADVRRVFMGNVVVDVDPVEAFAQVADELVGSWMERQVDVHQEIARLREQLCITAETG